jgi:hypothetical protein
MITNKPQTLRDEYSRYTKILAAKYKPASLDDVIKTSENFHVEEQHEAFSVEPKEMYEFSSVCYNLKVIPETQEFLDNMEN